MRVPEPEAAAREAIRHWSRLWALAEFADHRHGFGDSDGGFGVTYPGDLDAFDRVDGMMIPESFVMVYGFWDLPDGYAVLVAEQAYLDTLAIVLSEAGHAAEAGRVRSLAEKQRPAERLHGPIRTNESADSERFA